MVVVGTLRFTLWALSTLSSAAIAAIAVYTAGNDSNHTGAEPLHALFLFAPAALLGAATLPARRRFVGLTLPAVCALAIGLFGVAFILWLDGSNRLVNYGRWIERGMPSP
jgi:hypothetical protein